MNQTPVYAFYIQPAVIAWETAEDHGICVYTPEDLADLHQSILEHGKAEYDVDEGDLENGPGEVTYCGHVFRGHRAFRDDPTHRVEGTRFTCCDGRDVAELVHELQNGPSF